MSTFPLTEAILLEIHQSAGCQGYQTTRKIKFRTGQANMASQKAMGQEVLTAIFDALDMDPAACDAALDNLREFGNAYKYLELNTWTFAADQRQILWALLGHFYVPGLARRVAFWNLIQPLDTGMPGGRFWYLPEVCQPDGKPGLYLPVARVVDWLLDLLGLSVEEYADKQSESSGAVHDGLRRSLYNWRRNTTISTKSLHRYFSDGTVLDFRGVFFLDRESSSAQQFTDALNFVARKKLSADQLRIEIPMTQPGRIESVLNGTAGESDMAIFVGCLAERYSAPSPHTIRQRLLLAHTVQDGYIRLLRFLCPGTDVLCPEADQNKLLQLCDIYKLVYNLTIGARSNCAALGEQAENIWFEEHLPPWDKYDLYLSILPSLRSTGNSALAEWLTRHFAGSVPGAPLEDLVGLDGQSGVLIMQRKIERMKTDAEENRVEVELVKRLQMTSPWRTLQKQNHYWIVSSVANQSNLGPKIRNAAIRRLREIAATPSEKLQATLAELDWHLDSERNSRQKDVRERVEALLDESDASPAYELWEAPLLQYKAKHSLACNDFAGAGALFRKALEAGLERNYGPLRGEVARDCFAVEVANGKLVVNNHEKYYKEMLAGGVMAECDQVPGIEETARWVSTYFWDTLYKPYPGIEVQQPRARSVGSKMMKELEPLLLEGDKDGLLAWIKANRQLLKSHLPDVDGNSVLMMFIKMGSSLEQAFHMLPPKMRDNWRQFLFLLVQEAPSQLNIADLKSQTPLMLMAETGDTEMVRLMLRAGANPELQDRQGMTALHSAIKSQVAGCVDALLDHPCRLNTVTNDGQSPLHTAAWTGNLHTINRLLSLAPDLAWQQNTQNMTPLERVEYLLEVPQALQMLSKQLETQGRRCPTKAELAEVVGLLEKALFTSASQRTEK
tara:strand:- start:10380 stop:13082 length:2703 start_codon:yes stop_codon:yes gene_type:complete